MKTETRILNADETHKLEKSILKLEKAVDAKLNWSAILILLLLTALFAIHIYYYDKSNWSLISKFLVCVCPIIIWVMIENKYKGRKKRISRLKELKEIEKSKTIDIIEMNARRIIEFLEKEDEGTLYLVENTSGECIYLWDEQYLLSEHKLFPCDRFDIYTDNNFTYAIEEKVYCKGKRIESIRISGDRKWSYFKDIRFPSHLEIEQKGLDEIIDEIKRKV